MLPLLAAHDRHAFELVWGLLDEDSRRAKGLGPGAAAAACCRELRDVVRADERLWPTVVLRAPVPVLLQPMNPEHQRSYAARVSEVSEHGGDMSALQFHQAWASWDAEARLQLQDEVAHLSPRLPRVRLEGFDRQPDLLITVVAMLPPGLLSLAIHSRCAGPLLGLVGRRFQQLTRLELAGNAAELDWGARGAAAAVPLLERLQLAYSISSFEYEEEVEDMARSVRCTPLPASALQALSHATRLHSLDLAVECSPALVQLLDSVTSLRTLRLTLLGAVPAHGAALGAVVDALRDSTHLTRLHLGLSTSARLEGEDYSSNVVWVAPQVQLPPASGIPHLHSLDVAGDALLPPDWRQLTSLRRLSVRPLIDPIWAQEQTFDFDQPLPALAGSLTQLRLPCDSLTPALCGLTQLRELAVLGGSRGMPPAAFQLAALTALTLLDDHRSPVVPPPLHNLLALRQLTIVTSAHRVPAYNEALQTAWELLPQGLQGPAVSLVEEPE